MAGYLFAYFSISGGKAFPAPHLAHIRGSSWPLPVFPIPVLAFFPRSLLLCELCCCSALTAMVTSKRHGHLISQTKEKSAGVFACVWMCQGREQNILFLSLFILRLKVFDDGCRMEGARLPGAVWGYGTGAMCHILLCPSQGRGCLVAPWAQLLALQQLREGKNTRGSKILKV